MGLFKKKLKTQDDIKNAVAQKIIMDMLDVITSNASRKEKDKAIKSYKKNIKKWQ